MSNTGFQKCKKTLAEPSLLMARHHRRLGQVCVSGRGHQPSGNTGLYKRASSSNFWAKVRVGSEVVCEHKVSAHRDNNFGPSD